MVAQLHFFLHTKPNKKNAKELPSQRTGDGANLTQQTFDRKEPLLLKARVSLRAKHEQ